MSCRTLHIVRSLRPETGGVAEAVQHLTAASRARGESAVLLSLDPADRDRPGVTVVGRASDGYGYSPDYGRWLRAHAAEFDAVVVHGLWQYPGLGAWRELRGRAIPYLVFCHGMLDPWFKRAHPLKHAKKWLYWPWAEYRVLRDAAVVCFTAEDERRRARESFWLYRARERIVTIGIPSPAGEPAAQREVFFRAFPALRDNPFLLFLGRVHPKKGIDLLLAAWARAAGPGTLVIAGPGDEPYRVKLQDMARDLGVADRVRWLPMLSGEVKWGALRACEAFALLSHQENFGVAVVEALACGRPVLLSDQIAIAGDIAADGAGLVGTDTREGAADVLGRWRAAGANERAALGVQASRCFARRYEIGRAAASLSDLIGEVRAR